MYRKVFKRIVDIVVSLVAGIIASPFLLFSVIATKIEDPKSPVFFSQVRCGQYKKPFKIYKVRTMRTDAPKYVATNEFVDSSTFITPVGRFLRKASFDEIPQLLNIFLGTMSFVGPRPVVFDEEQLIDLRDKLGVLQCKPGITGYSQIHGRDELTPIEKARMDAYYLRHMSAWLDIKIMVMTVPYVLLQHGVKETKEDSKKRKAEEREENTHLEDESEES